MKPIAKILLPVAVLAIAGGISTVLMVTKKKPETKPSETKPTLVQAITTKTQDQTFRVYTQGTVAPLRETLIMPEVSGRIVAMSPVFRAGGFFERDEVLIEIDPSNYEAAVAQAEFALAQARLKLEQERARGEQARKEWKSLSESEAPPLALRIPQLEAEKANVAWSEQALERARLDLERTKIRAPYTGMVRDQSADLGQFVSPGTRLGSVFAVDQAEVRLPISSDELAYLKLPRTYRSGTENVLTNVKLSTRIAGRIHEWDAQIVRTEGTIDPTNRMLYAVARIEDPYGRNDASDRPPLHMGEFVDAEITGHTVSEVVVLPRQVLRGTDRVLVIDEKTYELRTRPVSVLKTNPDTVVLGGGLVDGELVCTTALDFVVEGMKVELYEGDTLPDAVDVDGSQIADAHEPIAEGGAL